jgi:hypothetical protein
MRYKMILEMKKQKKKNIWLLIRKKIRHNKNGWKSIGKIEENKWRPNYYLFVIG